MTPSRDLPAPSTERLRESEEQLRLVLEASDTGVWTWDLGTDAVIWSPECYRIHGISEEEFDRTGAGFFQLVHPDDKGRVESTVRSAAESRNLYECEFRIVRPRAEVLWVANRGRATYDTAGRPLRMIGTITDITQRKRIEEGLQQTRALLQAVIDGSTALVFAKDLEGRYFLTNRRWREFVGLSAEQADGISDEEVFGPEVAALLRANDRQVLETREQLAFEESAMIQGRPVTYLSSKFPLTDPDGRVYAVCGISADITELKRSQAALAAREWELQTLTDNTPDILSRFDRKLRHVFVNAAVESATGRPRAEFLGKTNRDLGMPEDLCRFWDQMLQEVFDSEEPREIEFSYPSTQGPRHYVARLVPERGLEGKVEFVLGVTHDITERKRFEQALSDQDRRKDEFLATLSHELRNPLAPLRNGLAMLRMGTSPEQNAKVLGIMDRQLAQMVHLVDDLLDLSRVGRGKITLRLERLMIREVVDEAVEACRPTIHAKKHALEVDLPATPLEVYGDHTRLVQVLSNLLTNAAKYTDAGGRLHVAAARDNGAAVLRVADTGVGIAPDLLPTIWDMFTQVRDTLDKAQGGLGIGLSLVRKLVEMHGGTVAAESDGPGRGSTFTVRLPLAAEEKTAR